jgi:hypothetical protein
VQAVRKLIAFDDDTFDKLRLLARDRMGTIDLKDALRKSAAESRGETKDNVTELRPRKPRRP